MPMLSRSSLEITKVISALNSSLNSVYFVYFCKQFASVDSVYTVVLCVPGLAIRHIELSRKSRQTLPKV